MPDKLYWNTVTPLLRTVLDQLMVNLLFASFRLVGGTSLSLQLGHRISVDIDLFSIRFFAGSRTNWYGKVLLYRKFGARSCQT